MIWLPMRIMSPPARRDGTRPGFTLVELLMAMAATLLMMAALARAFAFVGTNIRNSRAEIQLSNELRDITMRIGDELSRCTVSLEPNLGQSDQAGYFMFHEGPVTNVTSSIFLTTGSAAAPETPASRYGDFDDYLAFTAVAPEGTWFSGKVPQGVLDGSGATTLVTIQSRYAEIAYFVAPDLVTGDVDGNGMPDRFRLHRRVLLIRPDLNNGGGVLPFYTLGSAATPDMPSVHQTCDLSIRRVLNSSGANTAQVAANSLADLTQPHNRFAHVRVPVTSSSGNLSMPVLNLDSSVAVINGPVAPTTGIYSTTFGTGTGTLATPYVLGPPPTTTASIPLRFGEDLALNNVLSFDVKIYDESASWFSDASGLVIGPNDPGYRQVPTTSPAFDGGYVDLAYGVLAGGPLRGSLSLQPDAVTTTTSAPVNFAAKVSSDFSGVDAPGSSSATLFTDSLLRSGRAFGTTGGLQIFQPTFDTFTSAYEHDGLEQTIVGAGAAGTIWLATATTPDRAADGLDDAADADLVADNFVERETTPPFLTTPQSIQVSIRIENPGTRQLQQSSVTWDGK